MLTLGVAVRVKDRAKGRPKKWIITKFIPADDPINDLVVIECLKTKEQKTVNLESLAVYPVKLQRKTDVETTEEV